MKRVSMKDIALAAKLSKTTVSWILNGRGEEHNISSETIERVLSTAERLNYQPNYLAKSLSLGKSNTIGLIVPRITDSFFAQIAEILEKEAGRMGYTIIYGSAEEKQDREQILINTFLGKQVDGLIIASSLRNEKDIKQLNDTSYPFVLIDRFYPNIDTNYVVVEDEPGTYNLISNLLTKGRKNIGMITVSSYLDPIQKRESGYRHALTEHGVPFDSSLVKEVDLYNVEVSVHNAIKELLSVEKQIDAIFFVTHYLAALGFKYLKQQNIIIPDDIALCCFGDSPYLEILDPPITAIPMPSEEIAKEALRILINNIEKRADKIERIILPVKIAERDSW